MKSLKVAVIAVLVSLFYVAASHTNSFDMIRGCAQYNSAMGYDDPLFYFTTSNLRNVRYTNYSKTFNIAILGHGDGYIRYGRTLFPYGRTVIEIEIGGWGNMRSIARQQYRTMSTRHANNQIGEQQTPSILSPYHPTMFTLEVFNNGTVEVTLAGDIQPFLTFVDSRRIPANYMAFTKRNRDLIFFYDCPLTP
uniref:Farnesoic acid O-methyl transferase domain-containing protein n=1 Tax=Anopheles dirus TaxID=7168 RepID=A0A9I3EHY4_9DIPT